MTKRWELAVCAGMVVLAGNVGAQDALNSLEPEGSLASLETLQGLTVVGSTEEVWNLAGSAAYIESSEFRDRGYTDIAKILARVPGVYVRQEDGYGNFPNISLRGGDGTRTEKVTVMEDGILTAPAPYSAPAAYYFPKSSRMSAIEVLKGSSQVRYGPQTTGGVLNLISTEVPELGGANFYTRTTAGSDNTLFTQTYYGDTIELENGRFGYLLELHGQQSDGFREYLGGLNKDSGFRYYEPMLKMFWELDGPVKQRFEFKLGYTDFESDEGYLGLTESDARNLPNTRYSASQFDKMESEQTRTYFKYIIEPSDELSVESALYWNVFERNWYKLDHVSATQSPAIDGRGRIGTGRTSLNAALLNPALTDVLKGLAPGSIGVKANARYYNAFGWQNQATYLFETGNVAHELVGGFRLHYDRVFREQWVDVLNANGNGTYSNFRNGILGEESNRLEEAAAASFYLEDVIKIGAWTFRPGVRYEHVAYDSTNFNGTGIRTSDDLGVWGGGLGFNYEFDDCNAMYGGIYRGYSLPGPDSYINGGVDIEESIGYELGWRYRNSGLIVDTAAFFTDFENLIGVDAGLGNGVNANAGAAEVWGLETAINYDPTFDRGYSFQLPMYVSATWTSAELESGLVAGGADNIYAGGQPGANIPYIPEWKLAAGIGYTTETWGVNLDGYFTSSTYGTALNSPVPVTTARQGKIDALLIFDLSAHYNVNEQVKLIGGLHNLFDERGITTRLPEGPRTNLPRTWFAGVEAAF
ncbi:TonB-dependent receptor family protein [Haloferula sp.]|uniref:TonB-dependent receptor family protein n=1 Tax=Haloferula sp. TaxID=2497595 RepID=UPI003C71E5C0